MTTIFSRCCDAPIFDTTAKPGDVVDVPSISKIHPGAQVPVHGEVVRCPSCGKSCWAYAKLDSGKFVAVT